jgi:hypothetical protein
VAAASFSQGAAASNPTMKRRGNWLLVISLTLLALTLSAAQTANRAGLIVRFGDERVETYCVSFVEDEITGRDLLARAGLVLETEEVGMGASVCKIDDVGCASSNCFCECRGGSCTYWSFWRLRDGAWQYAATGASITPVQHGDVQGWSWGPGSVTEAISPPTTTFEDICAGETSATDEPSANVTGGEPDTALNAPGATEDQEGAVPSSYIYFGLLMLILGLVGGLAYVRRRA